MTLIAAGHPAPDFTLDLDDGTSFTLAAHRGRFVVLFFYPADNTPGCTTENLEFSALAGEFASLGVSLVGISPDTIDRHCRFRDKHGLVVPLAADPEHIAINAFKVWQAKKLYGREFMGLARTTFIVAPDRTIAAVIKANRVAGHAEKVLQALREHLAHLTAV